MEVTTVFCVLGVTAIFLVLYTWKRLWFSPQKMEKCLRDQGLKGSPYKFIFGDLIEMGQMTRIASSKPINLTNDVAYRVFPFFYKSVTTHGKNCFTWKGTNPVIHLSEPSMIQEMLVNYRKFNKARDGNPLSYLLATGLFGTEGDQWVKHRKIIGPAFHVEKIKRMEAAIYTSCSEMIEKWEKLLTEEGSCEVDVVPYFNTFSGDVISRAAFGSNFEEGRKIFELQKQLAKLVLKSMGSIYIPGSIFLPTKNNKRMKEIDRTVNTTIKGIIDKRVVLMKSGETSNDDLLGILLDSNNKEIKEHENGLTIDQVINECKLFYFAGQDTTANTLVWTMILLSHHKDWQTHARDEVLHVFGKRRPDINDVNKSLKDSRENLMQSSRCVCHIHISSVRIDDTNGIYRMNMILNEVLRLYPVAPLQRRLIHEETKLGNLTLQPGSIICLNILFIQRDKEIWGEDANEFNPERFSKGVLNATKQGEALFLPFGGGPRICIGQNLAMVEMKIALAMILQHFSFDLSPSYSHAPSFILTLQPQFGAHLILHKL